VLIDGENVIRGWRNYCLNSGKRSTLDYVKLITKLAEGTNLLRAIFYDATPENMSDKKKIFQDYLHHNGIQLRTKILKIRTNLCGKCGNKEIKYIQKGVDVSLATDILRHSLQKSCDIYIVVSGDEDYKDAIECAKERGVKVWVASFRKSLSSDLRKSADKVILLDDINKEIRKNSDVNQNF